MLSPFDLFVINEIFNQGSGCDSCPNWVGNGGACTGPEDGADFDGCLLEE